MSENRIFVVMSNDFPDCVFDEKWKADIYCALQREWQRKEAPLGIYYRPLEFTVNSPGNLEARRRKRGLGTHFPTKREQEEFRASLRAAWEAKRLSQEAGS